eukprot:m.71688 g.71688  ORF g.71688 m.71688 type:complete len:699 (-) comp24380_c1_seq1:84-2180(-)
MGKGKGKGELCSCNEDDVKMLVKGESRRCTDLGFLALFMVCCVGIAYVAYWCFDHGDAYQLVYGLDSWGNTCGRDNTGDTIADTNFTAADGTIYKCDNCALDLTSRPHQFRTDVGFTPEEQVILGITVGDANSDLRETMVICAKACPDRDVTCGNSDLNFTYCKDTLGLCLSTAPYTVPTDVGNPDRSFEYPVGSGNYTGCPSNVEQTDEAMYIKRCIPKTWSEAVKTTSDILSYAEEATGDFTNELFSSYLGEIYDSFYQSWREIVYCLLIALVVSYLIIVLMRYIVKPVVWTLIVCAILLSAALTWFLYERWIYTNDLIQEQESYDIPIAASEKRERSFYYYTGISMMVFTIIITLIIVALRNDIKVAIAVYEEASRALRKMPTVFITPLTTWIMIMLWFGCWVFTMCFMITSDVAYPVFINGSNYFYGHVKYIELENYNYFFWFSIFAFLWVLQLFVACQQMIIAGCVTKYYVTGGDPPNGAFCRSVYILMRYHLGTACFGSLIIAVVQLIRILFEYVKRKTDGPNKGTLVKFVEKCLTCCLWCLEKCLKFINKNAYIETMLCGLDFCSAACQAFKVILKNILKIGALTFVGTIVIFMIKLLTSCLVAFIAFEWLKDRPEITLLGLVVFFVFVVGWFVGDAFASVYEMVADTLLICFCEDKAQNGGEPKGPKTLAKLINKHGKLDKKEETQNVEG